MNKLHIGKFKVYLNTDIGLIDATENKIWFNSIKDADNYIKTEIRYILEKLVNLAYPNTIEIASFEIYDHNAHYTVHKSYDVFKDFGDLGYECLDKFLKEVAI